MASPLRIGIFGGAFNPPHNGHIAMCHYVVEQDLVDVILIVPCCDHPYDKALAPYDHRFAMCQLAMAGLPRVTVSDMEGQRGGVSYTVETVRAVQSQHPDAAISLIAGQDAADDVMRWREGAWLQAHVPLVTIPRGPASTIPDISATAIRERCARKKAIITMVAPSVAAYINDHGMYV